MEIKQCVVSYPVKKILPYVVTALCALVLTLFCLPQDHELSKKTLFFIDVNKQIQYLTNRDQSNKISDGTWETLKALTMENELLAQNETIFKSTRKLRGDNNSSPIKQEVERSAINDSGNNNLLNKSDQNVLSSYQRRKTLARPSNAPWATQKEEITNSNSKYFRVHTNITLLVDILCKKLKSANASQKVNNFKPTCESDFKLANSCDNNKCLQTQLPDDVTARVEQLVTPQKLQMSPEEHEILSGMADKVMGNYDIILLTGASSDHFLESQALLKNLHENVYPHMKNFTLVFYNLGLTEQERILLVKYCKCQVIDFPFHKFSPFMKTLRCYTWKPVIIKTHLLNANVVFWMDASIRFKNSSKDLDQLIQTARERGVQIGGPRSTSPFRTHRSMYHFFGDEPCAYLYFGQVKATFGVYHREHFVDRAILDPWVACALNENCMCLEGKTSLSCGQSISMAAQFYRKKGPIVYGMCHRFDQSAISLILHKLYQNLYQWLTFKETPVLAILRSDTFPYFESIMKNETSHISRLK